MTYGTKWISFLAPKIWSIVPQEIKNCKSLDSFKKGQGNGNQFAHVGYAKTDLQHVGFI